MTTTLPIANGAYTLETYTNANGFPCAKITTKNGKIIFSGRYNSEKYRDSDAVRRCENLERRENEKIERRSGAKERKLAAIKNVTTETIFYTSWGYDQTNVDFYQVVSISGQRVRVRRICQNTVETGFMSGDTTPIPNKFYNDEILTVGLTNYGGFQIDGHYANIHENGKKHGCSWYA